MRLVFVSAVFEGSTVSAKCGNNTLAVERAFDALPTKDRFADCSVNVGVSVSSSVSDVTHKGMDSHCRVVVGCAQKLNARH